LTFTINILRKNVNHLSNKFLFARKPEILKNFHFKLHKVQNFKRKAIKHFILISLLPKTYNFVKFCCFSPLPQSWTPSPSRPAPTRSTSWSPSSNSLNSWSSSRSSRSGSRSKRLRLQDTLAAFKFGFLIFFFKIELYFNVLYATW